MIYIDSNSLKMTILKSKNAENITKIKLINQTDKNELSFDLSSGEIEYKKNTIDISVSNIVSSLVTTGQYDYYLYSGDTVAESGILQFNNFEAEIQSYDLENKNTIQYEG